jgi:hypothetical protein
MTTPEDQGPGGRDQGLPRWRIAARLRGRHQGLVTGSGVESPVNTSAPWCLLPDERAAKAGGCRREEEPSWTRC